MHATYAKVDGFGVKDVAEMLQKSLLQLMDEMPHPKWVDKTNIERPLVKRSHLRWNTEGHRDYLLHIPNQRPHVSQHHTAAVKRSKATKCKKRRADGHRERSLKGDIVRWPEEVGCVIKAGKQCTDKAPQNRGWQEFSSLNGDRAVTKKDCRVGRGKIQFTHREVVVGDIIPSPHTLLTALGTTSPTSSRKLSKDVRKVAAGVPVVEHPGCGKLGHLLLKVG